MKFLSLILLFLAAQCWAAPLKLFWEHPGTNGLSGSNAIYGIYFEVLSSTNIDAPLSNWVHHGTLYAEARSCSIQPDGSRRFFHVIPRSMCPFRIPWPTNLVDGVLFSSVSNSPKCGHMLGHIEQREKGFLHIPWCDWTPGVTYNLWWAPDLSDRPETSVNLPDYYWPVPLMPPVINVRLGIQPPSNLRFK